MNVPDRGYAWWYVDALSDDGHHALTIIAFIGSVFSPYYARARRKGATDPRDFVSINVALYGRSARRWTMTERTRSALTQTPDHLAIGPSALRWTGDTLEIIIDERCAPIPRRARGTVRITPLALPGRAFGLVASGNHTWLPIAPICRCVADFADPALTFTGTAYFDHNRGNEPLEEGFRSWTWSREIAREETRILYDVTPRTGNEAPLALAISRTGDIAMIEAPPLASLPATGWRIARATRTDTGTGARVTGTLEDTPFYARSLVTSTICGRPALSMHESLDLNRFRSPIVQAMLPFRMPRRTF